jgi:CheY-like chemotaxis protein
LPPQIISIYLVAESLVKFAIWSLTTQGFCLDYFLVYSVCPVIYAAFRSLLLLEFFSTVLRREGYAVLIAGNGLETLEVAEVQSTPRIDILLSDVSRPYMGGIQLAEKLRVLNSGIQVLLTSGLPYKEVADRCGPEFKAEFLAKPFSVSKLAGKINMLAQAA